MIWDPRLASHGRLAFRVLMLALAGACVLSFAAPGLALDVVVEGASTFTVVGDADDPAVQDLQAYLERMSGALLPIVPLSTEPLPAAAIVVGERSVPGYTPPSLSSQGFHLTVREGRLIIRGGSPQGTEYGVYGLLDDHLGCRWLTPDFDYVPTQPTIVLSDTLDEIQEPSIRDRSHYGGDFGDDSPEGVAWRRRNRVGVTLSGSAYHNMYEWLPPASYYSDHPEWYPMNAQGLRLGNDPCQCMCWTNTEMIDELARVLKQHMSTCPSTDLTSVGQGDGFTPCQCPNCRSMVARYDSESAPLIYCMNEALARTKLEYPDHCIVTFAYHGTNEPPINHSTAESLIPDSNLYIEYVRMGDAMHNIESGVFNAAMRDQFLEWTTLTGNMRIWSWSVGFERFVSPFPNYKAMAEDIKWFSDYVKGFAHQGSTYGGSDWGPLRGWMFARLLWNADLDVEAVEQDFLTHYCGADAAPYLWSYLQRVQQRAAACGAAFSAVWGADPAYVKGELFPPDQLALDAADFDAALFAAEGSGVPEYVEHVKHEYYTSFAYLHYVPYQQLERTTYSSYDWFLPQAESGLADTTEGIGEALYETSYREHCSTAYGRQEFLGTIGGGRIAPEVENSHIKLGFCANLNGIIASLYDKATSRELAAVGPPGAAYDGGVRDYICSNVFEHTFDVTSAAGVQTVSSEGVVILPSDWYVSQWWYMDCLLQRRQVELPDDRRGFSVSSWLHATSALNGWDYCYPEYKLATAAIYDPHLRIRWNVWDAANVKVAAVAPGFVREHAFTTAPDYLLPMPSGRSPGEMLKLYLLNNDTDIVTVVETDWSTWAEVRFEFESTYGQVVLTCDGPGKVAVVGGDLPMSDYSVDVLTAAEADREIPLTKVWAAGSDSTIALVWQAKSFAELAGYHVYRASEFSGPYLRVTAAPLEVNSYVDTSVENGFRYYYCVTVVDAVHGEGQASPTCSAVPHAGPLTTYLAANDGSGDFWTIQEALDALPTEPWTSDYTIEVPDTSSQFPTGYAGGRLPEEVIAASQGHRLVLRSVGGRAVINSPLDLNGSAVFADGTAERTTAAVEGFLFDGPGAYVPDVHAIEAPGPGSCIADNHFREWYRAVALTNSAGDLPGVGDNAGTTIERNFFAGCANAIIDCGQGYGGTEAEPFRVRNNIFEDTRELVFSLEYPAYTYFISNTVSHVGGRTIKVVLRDTWVIANNLFVSCSQMAYAVLWNTQAELAASSQVMDHNLFYLNGCIAAYDDFAAFDSLLVDLQTNVGKELNSLEEDPLLAEADTLTDYEPADLRLLYASPAVDAGMAGLPEGDLDFFGSPRITGAKADIGAHELGDEPTAELPPVLLEVHPNERGQGPTGGPRIGTDPWQPSGLGPGAWYKFKVYEFEGSANLWIQVSAQCFAKAQTGQAEDDRLLMSVDGTTPPDVWGLQSGPSGSSFDYQWDGAVDLGRRLTLEFRPASLMAGWHEIKFKADATPAIWWVKVVDLAP